MILGSPTFLILVPSDPSVLGNLSIIDIVGLSGEPLVSNIPMKLLEGTNSTYISDKFQPPDAYFNMVVSIITA